MDLSDSCTVGKAPKEDLSDSCTVSRVPKVDLSDSCTVSKAPKEDLRDSCTVSMVYRGPKGGSERQLHSFEGLQGPSGASLTLDLIPARPPAQIFK